MKRNITKLISFLHSGLFYEPYLNVSDMQNTLSSLPRNIILLYGETYDEFGLTVDSLKYYFVLQKLKGVLESMGFDVTAHILMGDTSSTRNKLVKDKKRVELQIAKNKKLIQKIIACYGLDLDIAMMSDIARTKKYQERVEKLAEIFVNNQEVQNTLPKTVLQNRVSQEEKTTYLYTREEVALILSYTFKIGPPRELQYDRIAKKVAPAFDLLGPTGLYLRPTYPLGQHFAYFLTHPEIEELGITPYKAGSNQLQRYRIVLKDTSHKKLENLVANTYLPHHSQAVNPVFDFFTITDLAKNLLEKNEEIVDYSRPDLFPDYQTRAINQYEKYIQSPLGLGGKSV